MDALEWTDDGRAIVGMVHLEALPGSPGFDGDRERLRERALADARALEAGGVDAVLVENFGDVPFYPGRVPAHVVADVTALAGAVAEAVSLPIGINVLRNDAASALAVASAVGGAFVRVNVHTGVAATDQGLLEGRAHETLRRRERLDADVAILADVHVKHAAQLGDRDLERAVAETVERGLADGVIVSGPASGEATTLEDVERAVAAVDSLGLDRRVPVFVGSGVTSETVAATFDAGADGVVVGSALERDGRTGDPVERARVRAFVEAAGE